MFSTGLSKDIYKQTMNYEWGSNFKYFFSQLLSPVIFAFEDLFFLYINVYFGHSGLCLSDFAKLVNKSSEQIENRDRPQVSKKIFHGRLLQFFLGIFFFSI